METGSMEVIYEIEELGAELSEEPGNCHRRGKKNWRRKSMCQKSLVFG